MPTCWGGPGPPPRLGADGHTGTSSPAECHGLPAAQASAMPTAAPGRNHSTAIALPRSLGAEEAAVPLGQRHPQAPGPTPGPAPGPAAVLWPHLMAPSCTAGGLTWGHRRLKPGASPVLQPGSGGSPVASSTGYPPQAQAGFGLGAGPAARPMAAAGSRLAGEPGGHGASSLVGKKQGAPNRNWRSAFVAGKGSCTQSPAPGAKAGWLPAPGFVAAVRVLPVTGSEAFLGRATSFPRAPER